jgi:protein-S-isoprenylcysteine O-methyltransferase Ste14
VRIQLIVQTLVCYGIVGLVLFGVAGTTHWPGAWIFLIEMLAVSLCGGLWLVEHDRALMAERLAPPIHKDQPAADKALLLAVIVASFGTLVVVALDAKRFGWSSVPLPIEVAGEIILLLGTWFSFRTLAANSFASPVVKIQQERGQTVIRTGPYHYVRHPLYAGALAFFVGISLLLSSWWGLVAVLVLAVVLGLRIGVEEKALRAGLRDYDDYAKDVRYRLIPFIW